VLEQVSKELRTAQQTGRFLWFREPSVAGAPVLLEYRRRHAAAHGARAFELSAAEDPAVGLDQIAQSRILAPPVVVDVLRRYPSAPPGGRRVVGKLMRMLADFLATAVVTLGLAALSRSAPTGCGQIIETLPSSLSTSRSVLPG